MAFAFLVGGCASPVGVKNVSPREVQEQLTESALTGGRPSASTRELLTRMGLRDTYKDDMEGAIAQLHAGLSTDGDADRLFALAELSFLLAEDRENRKFALAAAIYAYAFLFDSEVDVGRAAFDPRIDVARNVYNRALRYGLATKDFDHIDVESRRMPLPFGELDLQLQEGARSWAGWTLDEFTPAADLEVRGLANRYRQSGLGAPLAASLKPPADGKFVAGAELVPPRLEIPVTVFVRFDNVREKLATGRMSGLIEIYSEDTARSELQIEGGTYPLELEKSSSLALTLEGSDIWDFAFAGFRLGDYVPGGRADRLMLLHPYRPGRIPLVLVHGTFSSPATWAEMVNELENDPTIAAHYQIWLFMYNTGNPIPYSAGILVETLKKVVAELDPEGKDPAMQRMVIAGHSQGGLLVKLTAVDSGDKLWKNVSSKPFASLHFDPEAHAMLERSLFFQPLPFVERVIFMSTPHHGSYLATWAPASWVSRLVKMPITITKLSFNVVTQGEEGLILSRLAQPPTSLDNMRASNPFLETLRKLPIAPTIHANSIIAVEGDGPPEQGGDGVVKYQSAHIDDVESELIVQPSGHSVHVQPAAIEEVRRILIDHLNHVSPSDY
jgi:pimeloyl-ACP methyl ester carboxylesterase